MTARGAGPFVGRDQELEALRACFEASPWVTVVGPGGMGKTRLAWELAARERGVGRAVFFVELAAAGGLTSTLERIGHALGIDAGSEPEAWASHIERLGPALLVLDEAEAQDDGLAAHVAAWASPSTRVLVTSRRALGGPGERSFPLEPLATADAVALFVARARAARASVVLDEALVRGVVDAIDRMPLAIELAASRLGALSLEDLARRLEDPLPVLRARAAGRHGSMRRAVDDSLELVTADERRLFALLATLQDGFTLVDAEAALAGIQAPDATLEGIEALVRASLLRVRGVDGPTRYAFFSTIREVAAAFDDPMRRDVRARVARHFASCDRPVATEDLDNFLLAHRASVERAVEERDVDAAGDARVLFERLDERLSREGRAALAESLADGTLAAMRAVDAPANELAALQLRRARARRDLGKSVGAREDLREVLSSTSAPLLRALASIRLAALDDVASDTASARARLEEALRWLTDVPDDDASRAARAEAQLHLGHALRREGRLDDARGMLLASAAGHRAVGDDVGLAAVSYELAVVEIFARSPEAARVVEEGLVVASRAGARRTRGTLTMASGCLAHERGELEVARARHAEAATLFAELGDRHREASALFYLATTDVEAGRIDDALALLARARCSATEVGAPRYEALIEAVSASALAIAGRTFEARAALQLAREHAAKVAHEPALHAAVATHARLVAWRSDAEHHASGAASDAAAERARDLVATSEREVAAASNDDSRFALRLLRAVVHGTPRAKARALVVAADGAWFHPPEAPAPIRLPEGSPLRLLLRRLLVARLEQPGAPVSIDALIDAGWPGEKIRADSALNRLYVAVATLRKRGLASTLERVGGGYLLGLGVVVEQA